MIDRKYDLSIAEQMDVLKISGGRVYFLARPLSSISRCGASIG